MATNEELANIIMNTEYRVFKTDGFTLTKNNNNEIIYMQKSYQVFNLNAMSAKRRCAVGILQDRGVL